jgi:hypothetical protein
MGDSYYGWQTVISFLLHITGFSYSAVGNKGSALEKYKILKTLDTELAKYCLM